MDSILDLAPGLHENVAPDLYHARILGLVNKGALDQLARTPAHYRAWVDEHVQQEETPALRFGKALHARVLEPESFAATYIREQQHPYRRPSSLQRNAKKPSEETLLAIEYWDKWEAESAGKIELADAEFLQLERMRDALLLHPIAGKLFCGGQAEVTALWTDPRHGLQCKARFDYWRQDIGVMADLKSTDDASPEAFARSVANYAYPLQQAHYESAPEALGLGSPAFLFVAQEKVPPYAVAVYQLDTAAVLRGHEIRDRRMDLLNECLRSDCWPSYKPVIRNLSLPAWALKDAA